MPVTKLVISLFRIALHSRGDNQPQATAMLSYFTKHSFPRRHFLQMLPLAFLAWHLPLRQLKAAPSANAEILTDFSGFISEPVKGLIGTTQDAIDKIKSGEVVHPRGTGHSCMGQGLRRNAWIFTPPYHAPNFEGETETITLSASSSLFEADMFLAQYGYMLPVAPDHRALSIGGVLSVGGYGVESIRQGALVNHVTALDIMLPDGSLHYNVPAHTDIAERILEGLGKHGTILSVSIKCVKKPAGYYIRRIRHDSYLDYIRAVQAIEADPNDMPPIDIAYTHWYQDAGFITIGWHADKKAALDQADILAHCRFTEDIRPERQDVVSRFCSYGNARYYVWSDHWIAPEHYMAQAWDSHETYEALAALGSNVTLYNYPVTFSLFRKKKQGLPDKVISMGLYSNFSDGELEAAKKAGDVHLAHSRRNIERGGAPYQYGWHAAPDSKI